jgi:hypothetical protein
MGKRAPGVYIYGVGDVGSVDWGKPGKGIPNHVGWHQG